MTTPTAYLHTWSNRRDGSKDCLLTRSVPLRRKIALTRENKGATAVTTMWQILVNGRWRRVWDVYAYKTGLFIGDGLENTVQIIEAEQ